MKVEVVVLGSLIVFMFPPPPPPPPSVVRNAFPSANESTYVTGKEFYPRDDMETSMAPYLRQKHITVTVTALSIDTVSGILAPKAHNCNYLNTIVISQPPCNYLDIIAGVCLSCCFRRLTCVISA